MVFPVEKGVFVPARAAYSHSVSVNSLYFNPVFFDSHATYSLASSHDTLVTGRRPLPQP